MSEFTENAKFRAKELNLFLTGLINGESGAELVKKHNLITEKYVPSDILLAFDLVFEEKPDIEKLKTASNKLFNILYKTLNSYPAIKPNKNTFIYYLTADNKSIELQLKSLKPLIKNINIAVSEDLKTEIAESFKNLQNINLHYEVKENILFPVLEKKWDNHSCLKLMWSFHDDIRQNIKATIKCLQSEQFNLVLFNELSSKVFFNVYTIIFREEKILFPVIIENIENDILDEMLKQCNEMGLPFVDTNYVVKNNTNKEVEISRNRIKMSTGELSLEQLEMIFKHLPVDITYVDETDTVRFYSNPPHRIFPRTSSIVGRKVQNCHPPESVEVVNKIVESFKKGDKDEASFWIKMGPKYVLIKYFAVRDGNNIFKGTLEVSQEISDIQKIKGERRLLDW